MLFKSRNIQHVPDSFFDTIDELIHTEWDIYGEASRKIFEQISCDRCGGMLRAGQECWAGGDTVVIHRIYCENCNHQPRWRSFRVFKFRKEGEDIVLQEIRGLRRFLYLWL